ncbi:MAG: hypothetical protein QOE14_3122 [Humisphaera sp.]|nr:hypothetical protein [Humisphaera sp.]
MNRFAILVPLLIFLACGFAQAAPAPSFIKVAPDNRSFIRESTNAKFTPWGFNYDRDHKLRLLEDYWEKEWPVVEEDFREMRDLGANVVRIHLQFGKFMTSPTESNAQNLARLEKLVRLAEELGIYLDITGLGSYRKRDVPPWYDALDEKSRWETQATFWSAIAKTLADRPGVFCYDLVNEPVIPANKIDDWLHPFALAGFHYVQYIVLDPAGRDANEIARQWTRQMTAAIRKHDARRLITVGMLPIKPADAKTSRGFVPAALKNDLDFISVHLYPETKKLDDAMATLKLFDVGKPVVIEEIFPLTTTSKELAAFIEQSRAIADGWIGFYWGKTVAEMKDEPGPVDKSMLAWLELFKRLNPASQPATRKS